MSGRMTLPQNPPFAGTSRSARRRRARRARQSQPQQQTIISYSRSNQNQNRPRNRGRNRSRRNQLQRQQLSEQLSGCAKDYLVALENPFAGLPACIPDQLVIPTKKSVYRASGVFSTGNDIGFIMVAPWMMAYGPNGDGNYWYPIWTSTSTFVDGSFKDTGPGIQSEPGNSPINYEVTPVEYRRRLVSAGLRVRYIGPDLQLGGSTYMIESPGHDNLVGLTINYITNLDTSRSMVSSREWMSVVQHPVDSDELDFLNFNEDSDPGTLAVQTNFTLGALCVPATVGTPARFEFEVVATFEEIGKIVRGLSPSYSDSVGLGSVLTATANAETRKPRLGERNSWVTQIANAIGRIGGQYVTKVGRGLLQGGVNSVMDGIGSLALNQPMPLITSLI